MDGFLPQKRYDQLVNEFGILHLLYHRNYNQHHLAPWWGIFNILHRKVRQIIKLLIDLQHLKTDSTLRKKKQQVREIVRYLVKKRVFHRAFYQFNGIVALGQYITLGLAMLGNISMIYSVLLSVDGVDEFMIPVSTEALQEALPDGSIDDDLGEEISDENTQSFQYQPVSASQDSSKISVPQPILPSASMDIFQSLPKFKSGRTKKKSKAATEATPGKLTSDLGPSNEPLTANKPQEDRGASKDESLTKTSPFSLREDDDLDKHTEHKQDKNPQSNRTIDDLFSKKPSEKHDGKVKKIKKKKKKSKNDIDDIFG